MTDDARPASILITGARKITPIASSMMVPIFI